MGRLANPTQGGSMRRLTPSPAMIVALIALFLSLGGVSYGVATGFIDSRELKNNAVSTKDLKNNDIRSGDVRNNGLTGTDIANRSLRSVDFREGELPAGATGATGPRGPSDTFVADESDDSFTPVATTRTELGTLSVPAGKYLIFAKATLNNNDATVASWNCDLTAGTSTDATGGGALPVGAQGADDREILTLSVSHEFAAPGSISLGCSASVSGNAGMVIINAVRVETLSKTEFPGP
jgi:hypothetical protein